MYDLLYCIYLFVDTMQILKGKKQVLSFVFQFFSQNVYCFQIWEKRSSTVEGRYNASSIVRYYVNNYKSGGRISRSTQDPHKTPQCVALTGEPWLVFCEYLWEIDRVITAAHCTLHWYAHLHRSMILAVVCYRSNLFLRYLILLNGTKVIQWTQYTWCEPDSSKTLDGLLSNLTRTVVLILISVFKVMGQQYHKKWRFWFIIKSCHSWPH